MLKPYLTIRRSISFIGADGIANCRKIIAMAAEVAGGMKELKRRPIISFNVCPTSPLKLVLDCTDVIIESARGRIPINIISMALAGATTPVTLAGLWSLIMQSYAALLS